MTKLHELSKLGQSIWLDYIRRSLITSGELKELINKGLRGMTSNPSIFEKAINGSSDYDESMKSLKNKSAYEIYENLVIEDIVNAADKFRPVYEETNGLDGYVSLEANPELAYDTDGTINEVLYLFKTVNRPNVMFKVPATPPGIPAIEKLISEGININITLIFSLSQYNAVAEAYISGLEKLDSNGGDISKVASVASFFVSRIDTVVDKELEKIGNTELQGKIAVACAKMVYASFCEIFNTDRWKNLASKGAHVQRPLWGSTSTKNPKYPDLIYVDNLIGKHTVNTLPLNVLEAFLDHGRVELTIEKDLEEAKDQIKQLEKLGIDLNSITEDLQKKGVEAFAESFNALISSIRAKSVEM
ncbi:MAG: transaldolase [bacterium]